MMLQEGHEMNEGVAAFVPAEEVIRIIGISVGPVKANDKPIYIVLKRDGEKVDKLPPKITSGWRRWSLSVPLVLEQGSELVVKLLRKRWMHKDDLLAKPKISFDRLQLFLDSATQSHPIDLQINPDPEMRLNLDPGNTTPELRMSRVIQKLKETPSLLERTGKWRDPLATLLEVSVAVSELHPVAKAVFATVNVVYRKIQAQDERIEQIRDLVEKMVYMCRCIREVKQSARSSLFEETISETGPLVIRIEKFISLWATSGPVDIFVNDSRKNELDELNKDCNTFRERFDRGIMMNVNTSVRLLLEERQDEKAEELLKQLLPRGIDGVLPATNCLEGTREDILKFVDVYLGNFEESNNILWIRGHPGVGKSAIASTIVSRLDNQRRPVLHFIFERAKADIATPSSLWRYVGYKLARWYPSAKKNILDQLRAEEVRLNTPNSEDLFKRLVEQPLNTLSDVPFTRLPVIIIDGLDECGGLEGRWSTSRRDLLRTLKRWPRLSNKFRLVITSRPEVDIISALDPISLPIDLHSGETVTHETSQDIRTFFVHRFHDIAENHPELSEDWPGLSDVSELTTRAAGLFIWAETVVDFVGRGDPTERLQDITGHHRKPGMGDLYTLVLRTHYPSPTPKELHDFQIISSTMILAKRPLTDVEFNHLFGISQSGLNTFRINLHSVLDRKDAHTLRFAHQSFVDFLLDPHDSPEQFRITNSGERRYLIDACLKAMSNLRFNICDLETSTLYDTDIPGIVNKVKDGIPPHLSYSCCFWMDHLSNVPFDEGLMKAVKQLVEEKFLYWLEAMSLLDEMDRVDPVLKAFLKWSEPANDGSFFGFLHDARRFVSVFRNAIVQSTPHLYISALPLAPLQSRIAQHFLDRFPRTITVTSGKPTDWPSSLFVTEHHEGTVTAVVFSPDQGSFASCSDTICICDAENGSLLLAPFRGHSEKIWSIAFSPDGSRIASGSDRTVSIWDIKSGDELSCFQESAGSLYVTYSHDGQKLASFSFDALIRVWDLGSGREIGGQFETQDTGIAAIVFSTDDQCVISGSESGTVGLWYLDGTPPSCVKLQTSGMDLDKVAFSPNGHFMAAGGSTDGIISIWEVWGGCSPVNTFNAHPGGIQLVTYSNDGERLVSVGRPGQIVKVWDPFTGEMVFQHLSLHSMHVRTVMLSASSAKLAVGGYDGTVGMWGLANVVDASSPQAQTKTTSGSSDQDNSPLPTLPTTVNRIAFSPCGKKVISGSEDAIWIWDVNTGELLSKSVTMDPVINIVVSPDGRWIASLSYSGSISIRDAMGRHVRSSKPAEVGVLWEWCAFLPDSKNLVSAAGDRVYTWDVATMEDPFRHPTNDSLVWSLSPDGTKAIWSTDEKPPQMWNTETKRFIPVDLKEFTYQAYVVFSPSGKLVCSFFLSEVIQVWDVTTGKELVNISPGEESVSSLAFSPDDHFVAVGFSGGVIWVIDLVTSSLVYDSWHGHTNEIKTILFSPDGNRVASCSEDGIIKIWDTSDLIDPSPRPPTKGPGGPLIESCILDNGWVKTADGKILFWVPPLNRKGLYWPRNTVIIGEGAIKLDLTNFEYGDNWQECRGSE